MNNNFINTKKAIEFGNQAWNKLDTNGLLNIAVEHLGNAKLRTIDGHEFINMCSCSYLGLEFHPEIVAGGIEGLLRVKSLNLSSSRLRVHPALLDEVESELSELFRTKAITTISCAAATSGFLPLLASGELTGAEKPVMIFDKNCHFSMNHIKPICGDETFVMTCPHNDLKFIEDVCKKHNKVAYIADGAYSMGGHTPIKDLLTLQDKYGLFLYFDDSHSLSVYGKHGEGFVRSHMDELSEHTVIVSSLGKAFGASGGVLMLGSQKHLKVLERFGGPLAWSQCINPAAMGAIRASIKIHRSSELNDRQTKMQSNIALFDQLIPTRNSGIPLPIRLVPVANSEIAAACSRYVYECGFYTSAVFFPIVARDQAGLRVMCRADLSFEDIKKFAKIVSDATQRFS